MQRSKILILAIAVIIVGAFVLSALRRADLSPPADSGFASGGSLESEGYPSALAAIRQSINGLSPTLSVDDSGWIVRAVSFVPGSDLAYVDYTDTRLALRILVRFIPEGTGYRSRVVAAFAPDELGVWRVEYGQDLAAGLSVIRYLYDAAGDVWNQDQGLN